MQITEEVSNEDERTDTEISSASAPAAVGVSKNVQTRILKNMVPDPEWFGSD